jgi:protein phosphatase
MPPWPSLAWEQSIRVANIFLPKVVEQFCEAPYEYLIEEVPSGPSLWDAWDDPLATAEQRFGWLRQIAENMHSLHQAGVIVETLRPEDFVITPGGQPAFVRPGSLLALPLTADTPIRAGLSTAPELVLARESAEARADLYAFGALLFALHVGRELTEMDFEMEGSPKPFIPRFPDVHPLLGRLLSKTFCREVNQRFPSDEAAREDPTGFMELVRVLEICQTVLGQARLEVAAWTTTGMVRTGNEDAFGLLHGIESHQDQLGESVIVLLADGMGGYEAGEVAAGLAVQAMRKYVLSQRMFALLAGSTTAAQAPFDLQICRQLLCAALREANQTIYHAARDGIGRRGMGCTAEAVFVNCRHVVVGHVGDSRTYHFQDGRLSQLTRDQTLVHRLVELGTLTPEEAASHPRRSELQQALGGHADVHPALCDARLKPGDWVVVCSDGLSNHITHNEIESMLQTEATSAEMAARRLVNFANIKGTTDNATVIVIRAT